MRRQRSGTPLCDEKPWEEENSLQGEGEEETQQPGSLMKEEKDFKEKDSILGLTKENMKLLQVKKEEIEKVRP